MLDCGFDSGSIAYCTKRLAAEGIQFATKQLPKISKAVLIGLEVGRFDRSSLTNFAWKDRTLVVFNGMLNRIFNRYTGRTLDSPDPTSIRMIRQVCEYFYKLDIAYSPTDVKTAEENFSKNENELCAIAGSIDAHKWADQLRKDFETFYEDLSRTTVSDIFQHSRPRSTSGTFNGSDQFYFAERESTQWRTIPKGMEPYSGYYKPYPSITRRKTGFSLKTVVEPSYSELLFVPKDSRGPRTIIREFPKRLETQMAYFDFMCYSLTRISQGAINFQDQSINRALAEASSVSRRNATIDLKDASDRVSFDLVKRIFRNSPGLYWFVTKCRSEWVRYPDGRLSRLQKLAGMGSGLTFPTMALLISLTVVREIVNKTGNTYGSVRRQIFIYGDDIIVPREWVRFAVSALSKVGLEVNTSKSFSDSHFRESCGADFFAGVDVSPVRCRLAGARGRILNAHADRSNDGRRTTTLQVSGDQAIVQLHAHAVELYKHGFRLAAKSIFATIVRWTTPGDLGDHGFLVDPTRGTDHYNQDELLHLYVGVAQQKRNIDLHPVINTDGRCLVRDPYRYLGGFLRRKTENNTSVPNAKGIIEYPIASSFSELTIPRTLVLKQVLVPAWFITKTRSSSL